MADPAHALQLRERADRLRERHFRIGHVQLVEIDALELEAPEAAFERAAQMLGPSVLPPRKAVRPHEAALGCDHEALRVRVQ